MKLKKIAPLALKCLLLAGCGTYVPEIQEPIGDSNNSVLLVRAIVRSVHCELRNAVSNVINEDKALSKFNGGARSAEWFDKWGVQAALTLTIDEKTALNPTAVWTPPNPATMVFSLAGGVNVSADATRIDILNFYYTIKELYKLGPCSSDDNTQAPFGSLLIQGDLKTRQWLVTQVLVAGTGETTIPDGIETPLKQNALTHQVRFEVISSGNVTPAWIFTNVSVNSNGPLLSTSRDRTHDLLLTFGPADPKTKSLSGVAAGTFQASQFGLAVRSGGRIGF